MGSNQLCWSCKKACGHCSWSKYGEQNPINGWNANPVIVNGDLVSYDIKSCPEFEADNKRLYIQDISIKQLAKLFNLSYRQALRNKEKLRKMINTNKIKKLQN